MRIGECAGWTLTWRQPTAFERRYVLECGDDSIATLAFHSACGSLATGSSADGRWTFKRVGFFATRVTVREEDAGGDLAVYHPATWSGGGSLAVAGGPTFEVETNFWQTRLKLRDDAGEPMLHVEVGGLVRLSLAVHVADAAARLTELPWLVMLACYLPVCMQEDATAAAVLVAI